MHSELLPDDSYRTYHIPNCLNGQGCRLFFHAASCVMYTLPAIAATLIWAVSALILSSRSQNLQNAAGPYSITFRGSCVG